MWERRISIYIYIQVKNVGAEDAGKYECQVSTVPKLARITELIVVVPKVSLTFFIFIFSLG